MPTFHGQLKQEGTNITNDNNKYFIHPKMGKFGCKVDSKNKI